jgi:hypothetical protein
MGTAFGSTGGKPCQNAVPWNVNRSRGATNAISTVAVQRSADTPSRNQRVTICLILRIVLIVSIGIVAGYCVECLAVRAIADTFGHRDH